MRKVVAGGSALIILGGLMAGCAGVTEITERQKVLDMPGDRGFANLEHILDDIGRRANGFRGPQIARTPLCTIVAGTCSIPVYIIQTYDTNSTAGVPFGCILSVDDVRVDDTVTNIKWTLYLLPSASAPVSSAVPVTLATVPEYKFYKKFEILIVEDGDAETKQWTQNPDLSVTMPFNYKKSTSHVKYYPVVVQNPSGQELLCGSLDPQIVNN